MNLTYQGSPTASVKQSSLRVFSSGMIGLSLDYLCLVSVWLSTWLFLFHSSPPHVGLSCGLLVYLVDFLLDSPLVVPLGGSLEEISTQNGPFNFNSNSMSPCASQ